MRIPPDVLESLIARAREAAPEECCGLLLAAPGDVEAVTEALPAPNIHPGDRQAAYLIDHEAHLGAVNREIAGTAVIAGYYHSHPHGPAAPSASDARDALPGVTYVIVGLHGDRPECAAWRRTEDGWTPEPLEETSMAADHAAGDGQPDLGALKTGGFIKQRQKDLFTIRLKCPGGRLPLDRLAKIAEVARKYGGDYVHLSVRQSVEIPYVRFRDIENVRRELAEAGQEIASCGARVRVPTACSGCEYNPNGLTDSQRLAAEVAERFFGQPRPLAHKFKICFAGCPIDCPKSAHADLGFQGAVKPVWAPDTCIGCGLCAEACQEGAIERDPETGHPILHPEQCLYCGDCLRNCPTEAWRPGAVGWVVRVGGKHGRHPILAQRVAQFLPDEKVPEVIEAVLSWYERAAAGKGRVRIGALLADESSWQAFLDCVAPVLGEYALRALPPPKPIEIHF